LGYLSYSFQVGFDYHTSRLVVAITNQIGIARASSYSNSFDMFIMASAITIKAFIIIVTEGVLNDLLTGLHWGQGPFLQTFS